MRTLTIFAACFAVMACDPSPSNQAGVSETTKAYNVATSYRAPAAEPTSTAPTPSAEQAPEVSVSIISGQPPQPVRLIAVGDGAKREQLADFMRKSGFPCATVEAAYQLEEMDGASLDIWKLECDTGNFQVTMMNDRVFIKDWTGNLLGR